MAKEQIITIRMKEEDLEKLDNKAKEIQLNRSELIRSYLFKELDNKTMAVSEEQRSDLNKIKELTKVITDEELMANLIKCFKFLNIKNKEDYRSRWEIDNRRKIITRFNEDLEYSEKDIEQLLNKDFTNLRFKYKENQGVLNLLSVIKNTLRTIKSEDHKNRYLEQETYKKDIKELERLRRENKELKEIIKASIKEKL